VTEQQAKPRRGQQFEERSAQQNEDRVHLDAAAARSLSERALMGAGFSSDDAKILADHMMDAALCGYEYSGLPKILNVVDYIARKPAKGPIVLRHETPLSASYDARHNVGMLAIYHATRTAIDKAQAHGMAVVGVSDSYMSGRSAYYVEMIARAGLVGIHAVSSRPQVTALGGRTAALGTNPIAFGFPTQAEPFVLDMGTSAIMYTDVEFRKRMGFPLPEGVAVDAQGNPTTDATAALLGAALPFGGHKGFGLALAMQGLALLGAAGADDALMTGYFIFAMRPDLLIPIDEYRRKMSLGLARVKESPRQPGVDEIRLPSEGSFRKRTQLLREGIEIDGHIHRELLKLAAKA
jgi:LDH2 family malate/lactate/ureidoglycolate dehydrogenase